jgi:hypothetical protein
METWSFVLLNTVSGTGTHGRSSFDSCNASSENQLCSTEAYSMPDLQIPLHITTWKGLISVRHLKEGSKEG